MSEYRRLDFSKLKFAGTLSMEEALENKTPIEFPDEVISGSKKVSITKAEKDYANKCVKLEISY